MARRPLAVKLQLRRLEIIELITAVRFAATISFAEGVIEAP
jgi:hypothetical protein